MRKFLVWGLWLIAALAIVGVALYAYRSFFGGRGAVAGTTVTLLCTEQCAERAQCGTTMESPKVPVILAGRAYPVVGPDEHDLYFPNGATAEIRESMTVTLKDVDGRQFDHPFSRIEYLASDNNLLSGWVPDWCIERP
jgi:hypothetical protein